MEVFILKQILRQLYFIKRIENGKKSPRWRAEISKMRSKMECFLMLSMCIKTGSFA